MVHFVIQQVSGIGSFANMVSLTHRLSLIIGCSLLLAACEPTIANRGNLLDPERLAEIKAGSSTREEVATKLGTPTQISTFDENIWYYFGRQTQQYSFLDPEIIAQQAVTIRFNEQGVVSSVEKLDPAAAQNIAPVERRTPTYGRETTVFEQLLGSVGHPGIPSKNQK